MDYRHQRRPSSERFLTTTSISPPSTDAVDELSEDDIFFFSGANVNHPPSSSTPPLSLHHHNPKPFNKDTFGILAALPESSDESKHVFKHKPVISPPTPSSSSSSRMIPKPPMERQVINCYHSSAPMNVPLAEFRRREFDFNKCNSNDGGGGDDDGDDEGEMLPPHEIVARKLAKSAKLSCSVLEGAGRTLKGRDLRQVRNAVFRQTGFID